MEKTRPINPVLNTTWEKSMNLPVEGVQTLEAA